MRLAGGVLPIGPADHWRAQPPGQTQYASGHLSCFAEGCMIGYPMQNHRQQELCLLRANDEVVIGKGAANLARRESHEPTGIQLDVPLQSKEVLRDDVGTADG